MSVRRELWDGTSALAEQPKGAARSGGSACSEPPCRTPGALFPARGARESAPSGQEEAQTGVCRSTRPRLPAVSQACGTQRRVPNTIGRGANSELRMAAGECNPENWPLEPAGLLRRHHALEPPRALGGPLVFGTSLHLLSC